MGTEVAVIGLGYVGLPLVHHLSASGIQVSGFDIDSKKVKSLKSGISYIGDVSDSDLRAMRGVVFSEDPTVLRGASLISICVPTPIDSKQNPDYGPMISAIQTVKANADAGSVVVIESTVGPGFTSAMAQTQLSDFGVVFSPERVDPSNAEFPIHQIPKVAGSDDASVYERFEEIYGRAFTLYRMPNSTSAELVKLLENTFRAVNLGFIHEFDRICRGFNVDTRGVVDAAATKPFGYMPFYPSVGVGGHCIPVDPHYLLHARESAFIQGALDINRARPSQCFSQVRSTLDSEKPALLVGVAYKPNVEDMRESPALELFEMLRSEGAAVYYDPYVPVVRLASGEIVESAHEDALLEGCYSAVIFAVNHACVSTRQLSELAPDVFDFCGALTCG